MVYFQYEGYCPLFKLALFGFIYIFNDVVPRTWWSSCPAVYENLMNLHTSKLFDREVALIIISATIRVRQLIFWLRFL